jgi:gamma-glutamylcyclotransferase (GGCT)/AIG2-like uncharacterized protein YtfP
MGLVPGAMTAAPRRSFRLFVYGTLMRGGPSHDEYCRGLTSVEAARAAGRRRELPQGYPMLVVPERSILAVGSRDPLADLAEARRFDELPSEAVDGPAVDGEIFTFDDPESRLARLDEFEGFRPGAWSLYRRALIPVVRARDGALLAAWAYVAPEASKAISGRSPTG